MLAILSSTNRMLMGLQQKIDANARAVHMKPARRLKSLFEAPIFAGAMQRWSVGVHQPSRERPELPGYEKEQPPPSPAKGKKPRPSQSRTASTASASPAPTMNMGARILAGARRPKSGDLQPLGKKASWTHDNETQLPPRGLKRFVVKPAPEEEDRSGYLIGLHDELEDVEMNQAQDPDPDETLYEDSFSVKKLDKGKGRAVDQDDSTESEKVSELQLAMMILLMQSRMNRSICLTSQTSHLLTRLLLSFLNHLQLNLRKMKRQKQNQKESRNQLRSSQHNPSRNQVHLEKLDLHLRHEHHPLPHEHLLRRFENLRQYPKGKTLSNRHLRKDQRKGNPLLQIRKPLKLNERKQWPKASRLARFRPRGRNEEVKVSSCRML